MLTKTKVLDKLGIWASGLCALHCLSLPLLIPVAPLLGATFFAQDWFERTILITSLIVGFWAMLSGYYRYHRQIYPLFSIAAGGMIYWNKDILGESFEPFTVASGALLIIVAHFTNQRLCKQAKEIMNNSCDEIPNQAE